MCVVVRLAQGGRLAWLSRFHSQGREDKVGVGSEGRGSGVPGGRWENRVWVGALRLGAGYTHCTSSTAEESQTFHNDHLYLLYLNPTLQPLSHTLKDLSSVVVSGRLEAKQDNHNALIEREWKTGIQVQYVQGNITAATTSWYLKVYFNLLTDPAFLSLSSHLLQMQIFYIRFPAILHMTAKCADSPYCGQMSSWVFT